MTTQELVQKLHLNAETISKVTGVSIKTAQKWIETNSIPEPAMRLLSVVYGLESPEIYKA